MALLDLHFVDNSPASPVSAAQLNQIVAAVNAATSISDPLLAVRLKEQASEAWAALRNGPINVATEQALADQVLSINAATVSLRSSTAKLDGLADDTAAIQTFLTSLPAGKTVVMPAGQSAKLLGALNVAKPVTIAGWQVVLGAAGKAFNITSSDTTVRDNIVTGVGVGAGYISGARAINATGTAAAPLRNVNIIRNTVTGITDTCIYTTWTVDSLVEDNYCKDFVYAGILVNSGTDIDVIRNTCRDATQGSTGNSYGIAITDLDNTIAARSTRVKVHGNTVMNIPEWEGIDTHGGAYISIIGNTITGCRRAIQALVGNEPTRVTAPQFAVIMGNTIDGAGVPYATTGVTLYGKTDSSMLAHGVVVGNLISNCTTPTQIGFTDPLKTIVRFNTGADQETDSGWLALPAGSMATGWSSNSTYPARYRIIREGVLTTVHLEGVLSRSAGSGSNLLTLPVAAQPGYAKPVGVGITTTNTPQVGTLDITAAGMLRFVFTAATTDNLNISTVYAF